MPIAAGRTGRRLMFSAVSWALVAGDVGGGANAAACIAEPQRPAVERSVGGAGETADAILAAACTHKIDPLLLVAVAELESGLDPSARGPRGGIGLLQVRAPTAREMSARFGWRYEGEKTLLDPHSNARIGAAYLARMHGRFGSWEAALAAYNLGPARLRALMRKGKPATSSYARAILQRWNGLRDGLEE